jgi:GGDEF domain-containing protein
MGRTVTYQDRQGSEVSTSATLPPPPAGFEPVDEDEQRKGATPPPPAGFAPVPPPAGFAPVKQAPQQDRQLPNGTLAPAPEPGYLDRVGENIRNSAVGRALGMEPTLNEGPEATAARQSMPDVAPEWAKKPLLGPNGAADTPVGKFDQQIAQNFRKQHPIAGGVTQGVQDVAQGLSTPENIALMLAAPESKILSAYFAAQAGKGAYDSAEAAHDAFVKGNNPDAAKYATEAGLTALVAAVAGKHALDGSSPIDSGRPSVTPNGVVMPPEQPLLPSGPRPDVEQPNEGPLLPGGQGGPGRGLPAKTAGPSPSLAPPPPVDQANARTRIAPTKFAERPQPAPDKGTIVDEQGQALRGSSLALPPPPKGFKPVGATPIEKPGTAQEPPARMGSQAVSTRPIVQATDNPEALQQSAEHQQPVMEKATQIATKGVEGAEVEGMRVKDADSIANKEERGKPVETTADVLGARVSAPAENLPAVEKNIESQLPVVSKDKIDNNGIDATQYQVRTGTPGEANQVSELQVTTPEMANAMKQTDDLYAKQKEAIARGDRQEAAILGNKIQEIVESAKPVEQKPLPSVLKPGTRVTAPSGKTGDVMFFDQRLKRARVKYDDGTMDWSVKASELRPAPAKDKIQSVTPQNGAGDKSTQPEELTPAGANDSHYIELLGEGAPKLKVRVATAEDASKAAQMYRDKYELSSSTMGSTLIHTKDGSVVGHVSYNGRVWPGTPQEVKPGIQPLQERAPLPGEKESDSDKLFRENGYVKNFRTGAWEKPTSDSSPAPSNGAEPQGATTGAFTEGSQVLRHDYSPDEGWTGFDLDKTLAHDDGGAFSQTKIGEPLPAGMDLLKKKLADGEKVRILTARVAHDPDGAAREAIEKWVEQHVGQSLPITAVKDANMKRLYDDRAATVEANTGKVLAEPKEETSAQSGNGGGADAVAKTEGSGEQQPAPPAGFKPVEKEASLERPSGKPEVERRSDSAERKRVSEMSPEEMSKELLTSQKTGLPNRRAFDEAEKEKPAAVVAMSDADGLKALNDKFGYEAGDNLLRAKAEALREAGLDAYHDKGDEFLYRGDSSAELVAKLANAREILRNLPIFAEMNDGTIKQFKGADFSYGTGKDLSRAETQLKHHKADREAAGERARGELRGIAETRPEEGKEREGGETKQQVESSDQPLTLSEANDLRKRIASGDVTANELRASFERALASESALKAELSKLTVAELQKLSSSMRSRDMKKAELVNDVFDTILMRHAPGKTLSYSMGFGRNMDSRAPRLNAMRKNVQDLTDEDIKKNAQETKEYRDSLLRSISNPESLEEFRRFVAVRGEAALSPEQKAKYDELLALGRKKQEAVYDQHKAQVSGVDSGTTLTYKESKHTKTGETLHVVQLGDRVPSETYQALNKRAKMLGGHYSSFIKADAGFQFKTKEAADKFMQVGSGETVSRADELQARKDEVKDNAVDRLRALAEGMEEKGNESLSRDRKDNTDRRARMAASAEASAQADIAMAKTLRNLAEAIEDGDAVHLDGLRTRTQVEALDTQLRRAKYESDRINNRSYMESKDKAPTKEDIQHATYPFPLIDKGELLRTANDLESRPGGKLLANRLRKYAAMVEKDRDWVRMNTEAMIDDIRKIIDKNRFNPSVKMWKDKLADFDRLQAAGIKDLPTLRAALREYIDYKGAKAQTDGIKQMKRALVGRNFEGFFPTPKPIAEELVEKADIQPGMSVLEPSAGWGNIANEVREQAPEAHLETLEMQPELRKILEATGHNVVGHDFLAHEGQYDRIVMNPPFEDGRDIDHVRRAFDMLKPGGRLVSIMSEGPFFRSDKKASGFREWLDKQGGTDEPLEAGSFKSSERPTGVATRMVVIDKAKEKAAPAAAADPETEELRQDMGVSRERLDRYEPENAVVKTGRGWSYNTIEGSESQARFDTRREALEAAQQHQTLKEDQYQNPSSYRDIISVRATKRLALIKKYMDQGMTEMEAGAKSRQEVPDAPKATPEMKPAKPETIAPIKTDEQAVAPGTAPPSELEQWKNELAKLEEDKKDRFKPSRGQRISELRGKIADAENAVKHSSIPLSEPEEKLVTDPDENKWKYQAEYFIKALEPAKEAWLAAHPASNRNAEENWDFLRKTDGYNDGRDMHRPSEFPDEFIRIEVPKDGKFLVRNTPRAIDKLLKSAPSAFAKPSTTIPGNSKRSVSRAPKDFDTDKRLKELQKQLDEHETDLSRAERRGENQGEAEFHNQQINSIKQEMEELKSPGKSGVGSTFYSGGFLDPQLFKDLFPDATQRMKDWVTESVTSADLQKEMMRETRGQRDRRVAAVAHKLEQVRKSWTLRPRADSMRFWDAIENKDIASLDPKDQPLAKVFESGFLPLIKQIQALKPLALQQLIDGYFPHLWERPASARSTLRSVIQGKRPFQGKAGFLKQRKIPTMADGLAMGLKPISWNPVDLFLHKYAEMSQYLMAHETLQMMVDAGTAQQVMVGKKARTAGTNSTTVSAPSLALTMTTSYSSVVTTTRPPGCPRLQ